MVALQDALKEVAAMSILYPHAKQICDFWNFWWVEWIKTFHQKKCDFLKSKPRLHTTLPPLFRSYTPLVLFLKTPGVQKEYNIKFKKLHRAELYKVGKLESTVTSRAYRHHAREASAHGWAARGTSRQKRLTLIFDCSLVCQLSEYLV